jgi:ribosomal protein L22
MSAETPDQPEGAADAETPDADAPKAAKASKAAKPAAKASKAAKAKDAAGTPKAAAKKAPAKKAAKKPATEEPVAEAGHSEPQAAGRSAAKKRAAKKVASNEAAAPGDSGEAQELAKAETEQKPARKLVRRAAAGAKEKPRRRVVAAHARYVRTSARKARMVCGHLRGKSVEEARAILAFTPREVARDWSKLLESAVANAESNHELLEDDLIVREAYADEGPTIKRFRPRAMGRASPIRKRTSHLTITLTPRPEPGTTKRHG